MRRTGLKSISRDREFYRMYPGSSVSFHADVNDDDLPIDPREIPVSPVTGVPLRSRYIFRGECRPLVPIEARHDCGRRKPSDFIESTYVDYIFVSDRVISCWEEEGFTGWTTYPVVLYGKEGERIDGYRGLVVTGRVAGLDYSRTKYDEKCRSTLFVTGVRIDKGLWDGSDIFVTDSRNYIVVTKRMRDVMTKRKIRAVSFTPLEEACMPKPKIRTRQ